MFRFDNSPDNIVIYENILEQEDLDILNDFVKTADFDYQGSGEKTPEEIELEKNIYKQYQRDLPEHINGILLKLFTVSKERYEKKYNIILEHRVEEGSNQSMFLNKWKKNIHMNAHYDEELMSDFNVSIIFYLNDNYDGGELNFPQHNLAIKPKANSVIIFPGSKDYYHEVLEVFGEDRYTSSAWFKFANREGGK